MKRGRVIVLQLEQLIQFEHRNYNSDISRLEIDLRKIREFNGFKRDAIGLRQRALEISDIIGYWEGFQWGKFQNVNLWGENLKLKPENQGLIEGYSPNLDKLCDLINQREGELIGEFNAAYSDLRNFGKTGNLELIKGQREAVDAVALEYKKVADLEENELLAGVVLKYCKKHIKWVGTKGEKQIRNYLNQTEERNELTEMLSKITKIRRGHQTPHLSAGFDLVPALTGGFLGCKKRRRILGLKPEVLAPFLRIKEIYEAGKCNENSFDKLKRLAKKPVLSRDNFNLSYIISCFRKINYYEGAIEAEKLQREILEHIASYVPEHIRAMQEAERENPGSGEIEQQYQGYFCLTSHMLSLGLGPSSNSCKVYEILTGKTPARNLYDRLVNLKEKVDSFIPTYAIPEYKYFKAVGDGLREDVLRGDLAAMANDSKYKIAVQNALSSLKTYLANSEELIKKQNEQKEVLVGQKLALAV